MFNYLVTTLFDIPQDTVIVVFVAAFFGLVFRGGIAMPEKLADKAWLLLGVCGLLIVITGLASWLVPIVTYGFPGVAQKSIAAGLGFGLMLRRSKIDSDVDFIFSELGVFLKELLQGLGKKVLSKWGQ